MANHKTKKPRKPNKRITIKMQKKLWGVFIIICILFVVLITRIMYIQQTSGARYEKIVLSQQEYDSTIIPFKRGDIVDTKGSVLATSIDVYNVILDCKVLNSYEEYIPTTVTAITTCFPEIQAADIYAKLKENPDSSYVVLAKKVSYESTQTYRQMLEDKDMRKKLKGIWFEKEYVRRYPSNYVAAATIGYATSGNLGVIGLESEYNSVLNGVNGRTYGYLNTDSNLEQTSIPATNGNNIQLTMDINIQNIVEDAVLAWNREHEVNGNDGSLHTAALVMNPNNGAILAYAQYPGFDLNNPRDLSGYYTLEDIELMSEEDKLDALNKIWQNFMVTYTYEPGSTFKPVTIAAALETGALQGDETFFCNGSEWVSGHEVHCVNRNGHGMQTIADALSNSCNDCLMQIATTGDGHVLGGHCFAMYQELFGFGQKTYIDLPGETSTANLLYYEDDFVTQVNLATNSFGQNFNVTMIQLASAFSAVINGGYLYQPRLVDKILDENGNTVQERKPILQKTTISNEVSQQMRSYLKTVVAEGTGKTAGVKGYSIGGKTGTAEKHPRNCGKYLVSFIGFAPVENPEVVVYVIVDEPNTPDPAHSTYAQSIVHAIFEQVLPYMNIDPEDMNLAYEGILEEKEAKEAAEAEAAAAAAAEQAANEAGQGLTNPSNEGVVEAGDNVAGDGQAIEQDNPI